MKETIKKIPKRLQKVEELFSVVEDVLEQTQIPEVEESPIELIPNSNTELVEVDNNSKLPRLFDLSEVRQDFVLARRNLYKLMKRCQDLMDQTAGFDMTDMKAGQIDATANLANSINSQIQTVMGLYTELAKIEEMRTPPDLKGKQGSTNPSEGAVFIGDQSALLAILEEND